MAAANTPNRGVNNTAFSPNPDIVAQLTGTGAAVPGAVTPTYASTMALDSILQYSRFVKINGVNTTSATCTVTTGTIALAGSLLVIDTSADASGTVTLTFGTGFKSVGTVAATSSTNFPVLFVSNGTAWVEVGRPTAAIANESARIRSIACRAV